MLVTDRWSAEPLTQQTHQRVGLVGWELRFGAGLLGHRRLMHPSAESRSCTSSRNGGTTPSRVHSRATGVKDTVAFERERDPMERLVDRVPDRPDGRSGRVSTKLPAGPDRPLRHAG